VAMVLAAGMELVSRWRGREPRLCRESVRTMGHPHLYDGSRAERELGLRYTPLAKAMEATVRWYLDNGLVTRPLPALAAAGPGGAGGGGPWDGAAGPSREQGEGAAAAGDGRGRGIRGSPSAGRPARPRAPEGGHGPAPAAGERGTERS
jgi:hypothetical protein